MRLTESIAFTFTTSLAPAEALAFVRDVPRSLADATFLEGMTLLPGDPPLVSAHLPVNTPLFGRRELPFVSELRHTGDGALLTPTPLAAPGRGWAEVGGEARVAGSDAGDHGVTGSDAGDHAGAPPGRGSRVDYALHFTIFLALPEADRWGTRALTRMIEMTAGSVLRLVAERFPAAVESAARAAATPE